MSWYFSHLWGKDRLDEGVCFWLDHRGDLKHTEDREEEYIGGSIEDLARDPKEFYPHHLWADNVEPETGIPEGENLNEGMRKNGVHEYKAPLGIKFHAPAFTVATEDLPDLTVDDFVKHPGRMKWITEPSRKNVRGGSPVLPIVVCKRRAVESTNKVPPANLVFNFSAPGCQYLRQESGINLARDCKPGHPG
jgi:hypothetical protein